MSKKYESGSNGPGTIANNSGDWGGYSYGTYQIATNTGTINTFMNYLKSADSSIYKRLSSYRPGTTGFNNAWKSIANTDGQRFNEIQHGFIQKTHYEPARRSIEKSLGISFSKYSKAVNDTLWSTAVQHGTSGALRVFKNAGIRNGMSDAEIIRRIYAERGANNGMKYFSSSSAQIRQSVVNRFKEEVRDALRMLG